VLCHALTGCDTSAFCGIGKKTTWDAWEVFPEVTNIPLNTEVYRET